MKGSGAFFVKSRDLKLCKDPNGNRRHKAYSWLVGNIKMSESGSPVFCGPITRNFGSRSQVFSLDQISLCLLS